MEKLAEVWDNHAEIVDARDNIVYDQHDDMKIIMSVLKMSQGKAESQNAKKLSHSGKISRLKQ